MDARDTKTCIVLKESVSKWHVAHFKTNYLMIKWLNGHFHLVHFYIDNSWGWHEQKMAPSLKLAPNTTYQINSYCTQEGIFPCILCEISSYNYISGIQCIINGYWTILNHQIVKYVLLNNNVSEINQKLHERQHIHVRRRSFCNFFEEFSFLGEKRVFFILSKYLRLMLLF